MTDTYLDREGMECARLTAPKGLVGGYRWRQWRVRRKRGGGFTYWVADHDSHAANAFLTTSTLSELRRKLVEEDRR